jgi:hypothetical protein
MTTNNLPQTDKLPEYTLASGLIVRVRRIKPLLLQTITNSIKVPARPTYTVTTMSGNTEEHPLDEISAQDNERDQARYNAWLMARREALEERERLLINAMLRFGLSYKMPASGPIYDEFAEWMSLMGELGVMMPMDPERQFFEFIKAELDADDITQLVKLITNASGVSEEAIEEAEKSFPDTVPPQPVRSLERDEPGRHPQALTSGELEN